MREPTWALNMLAEVLSAFSVDDPYAMVNVVFRVAENLDAEVAAILRGGRLLQSVGVMERDADTLIKAVDERLDTVEIEAGTLHLCLSPLGKGDYFIVGRLIDGFDLEERSLLRAMARSIELSSQVLQAMEAERLATRLQQELSLADGIQRRMLCNAEEVNRQTPELDVSALMLTSKEVGGDLYDWIPMGGHRYCFCIGDVSGKGVPAALLMSTCLSLLRAYVEVFDSPSAIMRRINQRLCHNNENCSFTTLLIGIIDARSGDFSYCNAGHNPSLIQRADGNVEALTSVHGPALGILEGATYGENQARLDQDDRLVAYTDGANETFNRRNERYGLQRLINFTAANITQPSATFLDALTADLNSFSNGEPSHDDTTLLSIRRSATQSNEDDHHKGSDLSLNLPNDLSAMRDAANSIKRFCEAQQIPVTAYRRLMVVIDDLVNNTINYGCRNLGDRAVIQLNLSHSGNKITVNLIDNGLPFNPLEMAAPNITENADQRQIGGLGIHLMRSLTAAGRYHRKGGHNNLTLELQIDT